MQGRLVDIEKLRMSNESVQAVGNMNVNARGDIVGAGGKIVTTKEQIMKQYYELLDAIIESGHATASVQNDKSLKKLQTQNIVIEQAPEAVETPAPKTKTISTFKPKVKQEEKKIETDSQEKTGIDAALDGIE